MKDEIKKYIEENNLLNPFNRNIARKNFWEKRNYKWAEFLFKNFEEYNKYCDITFANFLRLFLYDKKIKYYYKDVNDFLNNTDSTIYNKGTRLYNYFYELAKQFINFEPVNMTEIIYCYRNNLKNRPICKECEKEVKFLSFNLGYRKFCSQQCQLVHNNKIKDIKKSNLSDNEIRGIIEKIPLDLRNLSNYNISNNYINILESTSLFNNITIKERIYIFQNNLSFNDIKCPHCENSKKFLSQGSGYTKTCGRKICIGLTKNENYYNENDINIRVSKGGTSFKSGFLYVLKSEKINGYKIGITQDPISRLNSLKKNVNDFKIIDCFWLNDNLFQTEQYFHSLFKIKQIIFEKSFDGYSEIFDLNLDDLQIIRDYVYEKK